MNDKSKSRDVLKLKFISWITSKFVIGILLGIVSSITVNIFTSEYDEYRMLNSVKISIQSELLFNQSNLQLAKDNDQVYLRDFRTSAWEAAISSGSLYQFSPYVLDKLNRTYYEIDRINLKRNYSDEYSINLLMDAFKNMGLAEHYLDKSDESILNSDAENEFYFRGNAEKAAEEALTILATQSYIVEEEKKYLQNDNDKLQIILEDTIESINNEYFHNPLMNLIVIGLVLVPISFVLILFYAREKIFSLLHRGIEIIGMLLSVVIHIFIKKVK
jgi:hypothetical protein